MKISTRWGTVDGYIPDLQKWPQQPALSNSSISRMASARDAVEGDGMDGLHAAKVNDLAKLTHGGPVEPRSRMAFIIKTLSAPVQVRIVQRGDEILAGMELAVAEREIRQFINRLAGVDAVADGQ